MLRAMSLCLVAAALGCGGPARPPNPAVPSPPSDADATIGAPPEDAPAPPKPGSPPPDHSPPSPPPAASSSFADALLAGHNAARAEHCASPLRWSPKLAAVAQAWADHLAASDCAFEHSDSPYGENLAAGSSGALDAAAVVAMWVDERAAYDFARGGFAMDTGHFTQVVWRDTTVVGCGRTTCRGMDLVVCNYDPPGNMGGGYRDNVLARGCRP